MLREMFEVGDLVDTGDVAVCPFASVVEYGQRCCCRLLNVYIYRICVAHRVGQRADLQTSLKEPAKVAAQRTGEYVDASSWLLQTSIIFAYPTPLRELLSNYCISGS